MFRLQHLAALQHRAEISATLWFIGITHAFEI